MGLCFLMVLALPSGGYAQEVQTRSREGLKFTVPEDWPIEKRAGVVAPIPIEEYVTKKFHSIEEQLTALQQQLGVEFQAWEGLLKERKEEWSQEVGKIHSSLESMGEDLRDLVQDVIALSRVQPKVETLDREVSDQLNRLDRRLDALERRMSSLEFHLSTVEERQNRER
jgi:methyl-accepting chemotaxis protein